MYLRLIEKPLDNIKLKYSFHKYYAFNGNVTSDRELLAVRLTECKSKGLKWSVMKQKTYISSYLVFPQGIASYLPANLFSNAVTVITWQAYK